MRKGDCSSQFSRQMCNYKKENATLKLRYTETVKRSNEAGVVKLSPLLLLKKVLRNSEHNITERFRNRCGSIRPPLHVPGHNTNSRQILVWPPPLKSQHARIAWEYKSLLRRLGMQAYTLTQTHTMLQPLQTLTAPRGEGLRTYTTKMPISKWALYTTQYLPVNSGYPATWPPFFPCSSLMYGTSEASLFCISMARTWMDMGRPRETLSLHVLSAPECLQVRLSAQRGESLNAWSFAKSGSGCW